MNRTYSIVYNAALGQYQVASEKTKTRRSKACKLLPIILASLLAPALAVNINDGELAIKVSVNPTTEWKNYNFLTTNPVDANNGSEQFGFADWGKALKDYLDNPDDTALKATWDSKNQTLKDNVANYFGQNNGYLNINEDKTFTLTASETQPTEKKIKAGELIAISVGAGKNLTYELNNPLATQTPEPNHTSRLFKIEKDGTLVMVGGQGSSITIKGFKVNTKDGGAIYNLGHVFLGDNVTFEGNTAASSYGGAIYNNERFSLGNHAKFEGNTSFYGGAIYNSGIFSLGDHVKFKGNTALSSLSNSGGAIRNSNLFTIGGNAKFEDNKAWAGGAINNNKTFVISGGAIFTGNEANTGGAIYNTNGTFTIGNETAFIGNKVSSFIQFFNGLGVGNNRSFGGAIYNVGTFNLGNDAIFTGNSSSYSSYFSISPSYFLGGAIYNVGTFNLGAGAQFINNEVKFRHSAYGGAIANAGRFNLNTGTKDQDTTLFSGNLLVKLDNDNKVTDWVANGIYIGDTDDPQRVAGLLEIIGNGTLDMRDPIAGNGTVNQKGDTTWKLGGNNTMHALNLEKGTLYLYAKDEVDNGNKYDSKAKVATGNITATNMTLGSANNGATLVAGGGNKLSGDTLTLHSGSTLRFNVANNNIVDTAKNPITANTAVMQWDFKNIDAKGQYTVDVSVGLSTLGEYHLLNSKNALGFNLNQLNLKYKGNYLTVIDRINDTFFLNQDTNNVYLVHGKFENNGIATWKNTANTSEWNVNGVDQNWEVTFDGYSELGKIFVNKDQVIFGSNNQQQTIEIVNNVIVGDMTVDGGDYRFTGKGISTDKTGVGLSNPTEQLTLTNGANVDFTGITGFNNFANGIDINHGALTVSNKNQLGTDLSGVKFGTQGILNLDIAASDTFNATGSLSGTGTVNKQGAGTWQLDGTHNVGVFNLEAGTLALGNSAEITATTMTLGTANNGATLLANGGNKLSVNTLTLHSGSTFKFHISKDNFIDASTNSANDAVMQWDFTDITHVGNQQYTVDVSPLIYDIGRYHLLSSQHDHVFDVNNLKLTYLGHDPQNIERIKNTFYLNQDAKNIYLEYGKLNNNGIATWSDASPSGTWNVADENWSVQITGQQGSGKTFLTQDHVVFGKNTNQQTIDITHDVIVAGMDVTEGDYKFTGKGISTANTGVGLSNITEQLNIQNGAKVDFTGITGTNHFANGIDIADGTLTVSNKNQLGTDLSGVKLSTQGTLNLDIAVNDHFDAAGTLSGAGTVNKKGAGTWQLDGINSVDAFNLQVGALNLGHNAEITATNMTIGSADQHSTLMMQNSNKLSGDTLTLHSGGANGSTIFSTALSADNLVTGANVAAMNWDFKNDIKHGSNKEYTFDVSNLTSGVGQYHVLNSTTAHGFDSSQLKFTYAGFDPNSIERLKDVFKLTSDATQVYLDYSQILPNGTATWVNTNGSAVWNVADKSWSVAIPNYSALSETFLNQDAVVFGDQGLAEQSININAAGSEFELNGMAVNANTNYTFNGDGLKLMAGTEITKQGSGMLAFNNTVTGDVDLQGGSMIIGTSSQNKQAKLSGDVIAQSGTTLGGHGTIEGIATLNQGAVLSPGNSIGTLTVGELNLRNGSKVVLDTAPNGDSDKIIAKKLITAAGTTSGDITIGQNVTLDIVAGAGQWSPSVSYSFMTAEGTITGAFSNVTTNLAFLTPTLVIGANGAPELVMTRNNVGLGNIAKTYNQSATAGAINALTQGHAVYDAVVSMSDDQARLAYDNLSGELYASTESALFQNANRLHESMLSRIHENSTGLWLDGWGYTGEIKGDDNAAKVESQGSGLLLGYDWVMKENILIGAAVGYEESKIKIKEYNRKGENRVKSTHLMVYGNVDLDVIELKAGLNYSALRYKANRDINIPTLVGTANAKYRGHQVHAFVEASKKFNIIENYDVAPYLNVAYTMISAKDFTETGSAAALHAKNQNNNRTSLTLGVKNDWYLGTDKNLAITADLGWKHTFGDLTINKRLNFVGSAQSFNIKSAAINKNSAVVGLGIKGQHKGFTIDVGYQGEFNNKVKDHALSAKLKWSF